jgi:NAD+ kinase
MPDSCQPPFRRVALLGKVNHQATRSTLLALLQGLQAANYSVVVEQRTAEQLAQPEVAQKPLQQLADAADIAVVVGGDGNMLGAARVFAEAGLPVIGVNRGNLGFLTDLDPNQALAQLLAVLQGQYQIESRQLLQATIMRAEQTLAVGRAINEVVLHSDKVAHMIEFEVFIDDQFVYSQRADGLIVSTPTGSTAYSLSGGGPIVTPAVNAITLVPMFPHTLSSRPIVVSASSCIRLRTAPDNVTLQISCDGHVRMAVQPGDEIVIQQFPQPLYLVHPTDHCYYRVLRNKLGWGSRLF